MISNRPWTGMYSVQWITVLTALIYSLETVLSGVAVAVDVYTGETAKLFYRRSDRENSQYYLNSRAWRYNITFSIIHKGGSMGICTNDSHDLEQFCLTKVAFKIWNDAYFVLKIKHATFNDSGEYPVEHVFGGLERNEKITLSLKVEEKPTSTRATPIGPSQGTLNNTSANPTQTVHVDVPSSSKIALYISIVASVAFLLLLLIIAAILYRRRQLYGGFYIFATPPLPLKYDTEAKAVVV